MSEIQEFKWESVENFQIPKNSYVCGYSQDGNAILVGLAYYRGAQYPARIYPAKREAVISYGGVDRRLNYWNKVLVFK